MFQIFVLMLVVPFAFLCAHSEKLTISQEKANQILANLSKDNYFPYQDIIVNDDVLWKGLGPDCQSRYAAIYKVLSKKYDRPITVLDIGANNGFFSISLARDMRALSVMVDTTDRLADICELNTDVAGKLFYMKQQMSVQDLKELGKDLHFDVVIVLHVLHHIPEWKLFIEELFNIADTVIIETPPSNDSRLAYKKNIIAIEEEMVARGGIVIAQTSRVVPGIYHNLEKMVYGTQLEILFEKDVQSSMYVFDVHSPNACFNNINVQNLELFLMRFQK